ncbi:hypothetical protein AB0H69_48845 [Streptomyces phaeochromogenes]|uniref:hypothetical protein n=1 Tax=Streptomyces phaeochromogenes TaxID=1923 RepID=UPI0033D3751F|nr:hypothetical protein [Streptomyces phaeochromogenes]
MSPTSDQGEIGFDRAVDRINDISLPILDGWEIDSKNERSRYGISITSSPHPCPGDLEKECVRGVASTERIKSRSEIDLADIAKLDVRKNVLTAYDADHYDGTFTGLLVQDGPVKIAGKAGYSARWFVSNGRGDGGLVQSTVMPPNKSGQDYIILRIVIDSPSRSSSADEIDEITSGLKYS